MRIHRGKSWFVPIALLAVALIAAACGGDDNGDGGGDTLDDVRDRGVVRVGVNGQVLGFSLLEPDGSFSGFDVDFGHAVAAAVFGNANAVEFIPLTAAARFDALAAGEIDVLIRNTTWTISRDADLNATFATTTFYDGQGMMVRRADGFASIADMGGTTICVLQGTTTELNLDDRFSTGGLSYTPLTFEANETLEAAFIAARCDGWTSDKSQLAARRAAFPSEAGGPDALVILDETFSKEPLGPVVRDGDTEWFDVINWTVIGMIIAEEMGITSSNLDSFVANPTTAEMARLLGVAVEGSVFDSNLGLDPDFMQDVIRQVGNYGQVYARNVEPLGIARGGSVNALWTEGGLIYAPPWR